MTSVSRGEHETCLQTESAEYEVGMWCKEAAPVSFHRLFSTPPFDDHRCLPGTVLRPADTEQVSGLCLKSLLAGGDIRWVQR